MPVKKVTKKTAEKKTAAKKAVKTEAVKKTAKKKAVTAKKAPAKKAVKKPAAKKSATTIIVKYDVGMGNTLALRGDGPGLSWETGTIMENLDAETWQWKTSKAKSAFEIKFLINDTTWSLGENEIIEPGTVSGFSPDF